MTSQQPSALTSLYKTYENKSKNDKIGRKKYPRKICVGDTMKSVIIGALE